MTLVRLIIQTLGTFLILAAGMMLDRNLSGGEAAAAAVLIGLGVLALEFEYGMRRK